MNKNKKTILLVEDEAVIAMAQADGLVKMGYEVLTAHSGEEAVEKACGDSELDLVLMDIDLGRDMDGPEAARRILAEKDIPIVFLTSHMEREYVESVREITRYGYIIKNSGDFVLQSSIETAFELFNANRKLFTKEEEYRLLFESAPSGIFIAQDGMLKIINPASVKIIGYPEETLTSRPFTEFIHPEDLAMVVERYKRRISGEAVETDYPFRIITAGGETRWVEITSTRIEWRGGPATLNYIIDVTERQHHTEALREMEERYRALFDGAIDCVYVYNLEGNFIDANDYTLDLLGFEREEIRNLHFKDLLTGDQLDKALMGLEKMIKTGRPNNPTEYRIRAKNGREIYIETSGTLLYRNGAPIAVIAIARDNTPRRSIVDALSQSEEKYRAIFNYAPVGIVNYDVGGIIIDCNENFVRIIGSSREALVGLNVLNLKNEKVVAALAKSLKGETSAFEGEYRSYTADKTTLARMVCAPLFSPEGLVTGGVAITEDITERMRSGEELRFRSMVLDQIYDLVTVTDLEGNITYMNRAVLEAMGRTEEDLLGQSVKTFGEDPERGATQREIVETTLRDGQWRGEVVNFTSDGSERILDCRTQLVTDADGKAIAMCGISTDVTERKRVEAAMLEQSQRLRNIIEGTRAGTWEWNVQTGETVFNEMWANMLGYDLEELSPVSIETWEILTNPDDLKQAGELLEKHFSGELPYYECELRMKHRDGRWIWMLDRGLVITRTADGKPLMMFGTHTDITERKKAEEALRESERYIRSLLMAIPDLLIRCDRDGKCLDVITSDESKLYRGKDEALGRKMSELLPGDIVPGVEAGIEAALKCNCLQVIEYNLPMPHGPSWYEARIVPLRDDEIIALILDISERKKAEEKINSLLHEKELLLRETHHRVKNNMSTVFGLLSLQAECQEDPVCKNILSDAARRVQGMTLLYDRLYRSENYRELSVKEFLPPLVEEIVGVFRTAISITADVVVEDFIVNSKTLTPIGIIVNELITNSIKHAFGNTGGGAITVRAFKKGTTGTLIVADDGSGIPEAFDPGAAKGFGLQLVSMLAKQLKGEFRITRDGGTRVEVDFRVEER